jgi:plastocyanin
VKKLPLLGVAALLVVSGGGAATGADEARLELTIRNHRFEPAELTVPAGQRLIITVRNADSSPEEFESSTLNVEKIVSAGRQVVVRAGPLAAGRYEFIGEFHRDIAQGALVVTP